MDTKITDPTEDPKLPSFHHPALVGLLGDLQVAHDCWTFLRGVEKEYLKKELEEPADAYGARLGRAVFSDFFRSGIEGFAGVLSRFTLKDEPASMTKAIDDIDMEGNSIKAFFMAADALVLRDGGMAILVDMPADLPATGAQEAAQGRRPYLVARKRSHVINWRVSVNNGVEELERVIFLEIAEKPAGIFGVEYVAQYRVIEPGRWSLYEINRDDKNEAKAVMVDMGEFVDASKRPLPVIPVVWYSADHHGFGHGEMPMRQVAAHNIEHYQSRSDLAEKTHKCAMPVPVRIGATPAGPGGKKASLTLGPNSFIDLDIGGSFSFAEPSAGSLAEQRAQIEQIQQLIQQQTLNFMYGEGGGQTKTATQAGLEAAQTQAGINKMAERKTSVLQSIFSIWCHYTGETLKAGAGLQMSSTIYDRPISLQEATQLQALAGGEPLISQESAIEELQRGGINRSTTSVEEEQKRLESEAAEKEPADGVPISYDGELGLPSSQSGPRGVDSGAAPGRSQGQGPQGGKGQPGGQQAAGVAPGRSQAGKPATRATAPNQGGR